MALITVFAWVCYTNFSNSFVGIDLIRTKLSIVVDFLFLMGIGVLRVCNLDWKILIVRCPRFLYLEVLLQRP